MPSVSYKRSASHVQEVSQEFSAIGEQLSLLDVPEEADVSPEQLESARSFTKLMDAINQKSGLVDRSSPR